MRLRARARVKDGGYGGYGGYASALRADEGDDATLRGAGYGCKHCAASPCGYAARVWPCPPRGPVVPRWRLRSARPAGACPPAPRISACVLGAMGYGERAEARRIVRGRLAPPSSYIGSIDVPLDCRAARRWYITADGDALRSAVSAALRPRRQLPSLSPRCSSVKSASRRSRGYCFVMSATRPLARHLKAH